jgi:tetratricopeptide (TPR) repeat protein
MRVVSRTSLLFRVAREVAGLILAASFALAQAPNPCEPPKSLQSERLGRTAAERSNIVGAWFAQQGNHRCAIAAFEAALRADPKSHDARYNLGLALVEDRQLGQAASEFEALVAKAPELARAHLALGVVREELRDWGGAESELRIAVELEPKSAPALHHLGAVLRAQKRFTAAAAYLRKAAELEPGNISHQV